MIIILTLHTPFPAGTIVHNPVGNILYGAHFSEQREFDIDFTSRT